MWWSWGAVESGVRGNWSVGLRLAARINLEIMLLLCKCVKYVLWLWIFSQSLINLLYFTLITLITGDWVGLKVGQADLSRTLTNQKANIAPPSSLLVWATQTGSWWAVAYQAFHSRACCYGNINEWMSGHPPEIDSCQSLMFITILWPRPHRSQRGVKGVFCHHVTLPHSHARLFNEV